MPAYPSPFSVTAPTDEPPVSPEALTVGSTGLGGAVLAENRGHFATDRLRGLLKGLGAGAGGILGARHGMVEGELTPASVGYGAGGAALGYLGTSGLLKLVGLDQPEEDEDDDTYMGPHHKRGEVLAELPKPPEPSVTALAELLRAKRFSDAKQYGRKHLILRGLLMEQPGSFAIDSDDGHTVGLTHGPTGFRIHMPRALVPPGLQIGRVA